MSHTPTASSPDTTWLACEHAWLGDRMASDVVLGIAEGRISHVVQRGDDAPRRDDDGALPAGDLHLPNVVHVPGVTLPGLVNAHSHAFHRLLRGRTHLPARPSTGAPGGDTFWTWRARMYEAAAGLDPDSLHATAVAAFGEMALAGITCVGEFHYLHHGPGGVAYDDPNAMGRAVVAAADDVGIRITLLDTLYLTGQVGATIDRPDLDPVQQRFSDRTTARWAERVSALADSPTARIGAAIHSVRAVPPTSMAEAAAAVDDAASPMRVLHAHVAEQPREVADTQAVHDCSPTQLLAAAGALSPRFTAVHAVWLDDESVDLLARAQVTVCACPTTERDLADGVVDGARLAGAGVRLALGSDQHAVIDLFEEARALELDQRMVTGVRGHHDPASLLAAATIGGATSLGWPEVGRIAVGAAADLAVVATDTVRVAGTTTEDLAAAVVHAATANDVTDTMVAGEWIVRDGRHVSRDVVADLRTAVATLAPTGARAGPSGPGADRRGTP